jgi:O-antigen ligase
LNITSYRPNEAVRVKGSLQRLEVADITRAIRLFRVPNPVRWSLLLFGFSIPFESVGIAFLSRGTITLARVAGLCFFACCCLYPKRCFPLPNRAVRWFLAYLTIYCLNGLFIAEDLSEQFHESLFTLIQLLALFWIASGLLREEKSARGILLSYSLASGLLSVGVLFGLVGLSAAKMERGTARLTVEGTNPNYVAYVTAMAAVILIGLLLCSDIRRLWHKAVLIGLTLPLLAMTVYTGSRAAIAAFLLGVSVYFLPFGNSRKRMTALIWGAFAVAVSVYLALSNPVASARWSAVYYEGKVSGRNEIYRKAFEMITEQPILGWGPVQNQLELGRRLGIRNRNAHNLYLQTFLEVGLVGAGAFLIALWFCVRTAWRARRGKLGWLPLALLTTLLAENLAHSWLAMKPTWLVLSLSVAAASLPAGLKGQHIYNLKRRTL